MAELRGHEYTVYVRHPDENSVSIDEIIDAGLKALGIEGECEESKWIDWYED